MEVGEGGERWKGRSTGTTMGRLLGRGIKLSAAHMLRNSVFAFLSLPISAYRSICDPQRAQRPSPTGYSFFSRVIACKYRNQEKLWAPVLNLVVELVQHHLTRAHRSRTGGSRARSVLARRRPRQGRVQATRNTLSESCRFLPAERR